MLANSSFFFQFPALFFNSTIYEANFPIIFGSLPNVASLKFSSVQDYINLVNDDRNQPQGHNSEKCLNEIFNNNCKLSQFCLKLEDLSRRAFGYQPTILKT